MLKLIGLGFEPISFEPISFFVRMGTSTKPEMTPHAPLSPKTESTI
jgi:hypothetical protein